MSVFESGKDRQYAEVLRGLVQAVEKHGGLTAQLRKDFEGHASDVAKLRDEVADVKHNARQRLQALAEQHGRGDYRGPFASASDARTFGQLVAAVYRRDQAAIQSVLRTADVEPSPGTSGGYLVTEAAADAIIRNVEAAGVFERNCPATPVNSLKGWSAKRATGPTVYYPDYSDEITTSAPTFERAQWSLQRWAIATLVDEWMLASELAGALGDFIAEEFGYGIALAEDTNWFMGDGTSTYAGYTGLFKNTGLVDVDADTGDDTFAEVIAKSTFYLAEVLGAAPRWAHAAGPKWFMHPSLFYSYLGVRDSAGMPIVNVYLASGGLDSFTLMGYPVALTPVAPDLADSAATTCMLVFGALQRSCQLMRHRGAMFMKASEHLKFLEGQLALKCDVPQDMIVTGSDGIVRLVTAA